MRAELVRALDAGSPDWVALTEPALALVPLARDRGCDVMHPVVAMQRSSLAGLPELPVPAGIVVQPVDLSGAADSVSVEEALLVDMLHGGTDAEIARRDLPLEADALRLLPGITLLAAVDEGGSCVATAGTRVVGRTALVSAVATIPQYRRRGIAAALTSAALRSAREGGATRAFLDAAAGETVYGRLGFEPLGTVIRCERRSGES